MSTTENRRAHRKVPKRRGPEPINIYNEKRSFESRVRLLKESDLPDESKDAILQFVERCAANGIGVHRQNFYLTQLKKAAVLMGAAFTKPTRKDVEQAVAAVERQDLEEWTKVNFRTAIKKFYKSHLGNNEEYPPEVKWLKTKPNGARTKLPSDLLSKKEGQAMIRACLNPRDQALISLLFDSGVRIGEALGLRIRDLIFDQYGAVVQVMGKTGARRVRVVGESVAYLSQWLTNHPAASDRGAPLFVGLDARTRGQGMNYAMARKVIMSAARRADIKKKVYAHLFRHTAATRLAGKIPEAPLEAQMGWVPGSQMTRVYVHMSGRDIDKIVLKASGIKVEDEESEEEKPAVKPCPRCGVPNATTMQFCRRCGLPMDIEAALQIEQALEHEGAELAKAELDPTQLVELFKDSRVQQFLALIKSAAKTS